MKDFQKEDPLAHEPFSYLEMKDGQVQIFYSGRLVKTIKGKDSGQFLFKISQASERDSQIMMAKLSGKFKFGNEKGRRHNKYDE